ncbi:MAG: hypothetical protein KA792_05345 [Bacteroidales bacterium]|nr:hypothetical protein [Bacteroidales bacterium]
MQKKQIATVFYINIILLLFSAIMIISGITLQAGYHLGSHDNHNIKTQNINPTDNIQPEQTKIINTGKTIWGFDYYDWSLIHKISIIIVSLTMIYHIHSHWKWYKTVISKRLIKKNRQVVTLSAIFLLVALTGLVPWTIHLCNGNETLRKGFIEIHDKIALILTVYLFIHIAKRLKWYVKPFRKI